MARTRIADTLKRERGRDMVDRGDNRVLVCRGVVGPQLCGVQSPVSSPELSQWGRGFARCLLRPPSSSSPSGAPTNHVALDFREKVQLHAVLSN